jgi:hypothetical protein
MSADADVIDEVQDVHGHQLDADPAPDVEAQGQDAGERQDEADDSGITVTFGAADKPESTDDDDGDAPIDENEPVNIRQLRQHARDLKRELRELRAKAATPKTDAPEVEAFTEPRPTLADDAIEFNEEKLTTAIIEWNTRKTSHEAKAKEKQAEAQARNEEWAQAQANFATAKASFKARDYEAAELAAAAVFSVTQQGILIQGSKDPAAMIYGLGKNKAEAEKLAAIKNPIMFARRVFELEQGMAVSKSGAKTASESTGRKFTPEKALNPGRTGAASKTANLEALKEQARTSGDYSAYLAAKRG